MSPRGSIPVGNAPLPKAAGISIFVNFDFVRKISGLTGSRDARSEQGDTDQGYYFSIRFRIAFHVILPGGNFIALIAAQLLVRDWRSHPPVIGSPATGAMREWASSQMGVELTPAECGCHCLETFWCPYVSHSERNEQGQHQMLFRRQ